MSGHRVTGRNLIRCLDGKTFHSLTLQKSLLERVSIRCGQTNTAVQFEEIHNSHLSVLKKTIYQENDIGAPVTDLRTNHHIP